MGRSHANTNPGPKSRSCRTSPDPTCGRCLGLAAARPSSEQQPAHGVRDTSNLVGPVPPPILGLFSTATPPGPAWDLNSPAGPNHFCSSCSSWLYPSRASLRDGWPHFRVSLQPYKTAEGVSTGKPAAIVQDTQEEYKARVGCSPCRDSQCPRRVPADQKCRPAGGLRHGVENRSVRRLWKSARVRRRQVAPCRAPSL